MASVASIFASTLTRAAGLELSQGGEVLQKGQILCRLNQPAADKIPDQAYFELIDWLRLFSDDTPKLVFRYAEAIRDNDLGALGLAAKSAPTLRDSLLRLERYFRLITDTAVYSLKEGIDPALFVLEAQLNAFLSAGYTRRTVLEVILGTALKVLSNYTNHIADTDLDDAFVRNAWEAAAAHAAE